MKRRTKMTKLTYKQWKAAGSPMPGTPEHVAAVSRVQQGAAKTPLSVFLDGVEKLGAIDPAMTDDEWLDHVHNVLEEYGQKYQAAVDAARHAPVRGTEARPRTDRATRSHRKM